MNLHTGKAAFLDRDGVINHDHGYIGRPEDFELVDGVPEALQMLRNAGYALIIVSNQSGIGRGYYTEADYQRVTAYMCELLFPHDIAFDAIVHCPHGPEERCDCRKPLPGMLIEGASRVGAYLAESVLFGDKPSDIAAGRAAGVARCFLVGGGGDVSVDADGQGADLLACVQLQLAQKD